LARVGSRSADAGRKGSPEVRESRGADAVSKRAAGGGGRRKGMRRERRDGADTWTHRHVAATSAKPPCKTAGRPKVNGFKSSIAKISDFAVYIGLNQTSAIIL
jgi:hypothetical protein